MDEPSPAPALISAMTTEHFILQTAASSTISEAAARSTLYVMALSSSLVAMGFLAQSRELLVTFVAIVLPAVFLLGLFTVVRLVDTALENMQYLAGIARIRAFYRTLGGVAAEHFSAEHGRWPEAKAPSLRLGAAIAFLGTSASMIAVINNVVAGVGVMLFVRVFVPSGRPGIDIVAGIVAAALLTVLFLAFQRWRFKMFDDASPVNRQE